MSKKNTKSIFNNFLRLYLCRKFLGNPPKEILSFPISPTLILLQMIFLCTGKWFQNIHHRSSNPWTLDMATTRRTS